MNEALTTATTAAPLEYWVENDRTGAPRAHYMQGRRRRVVSLVLAQRAEREGRAVRLTGRPAEAAPAARPSDAERRAANLARREANLALIHQFRPGMRVRLGRGATEYMIIDVDYRLARVHVQAEGTAARRWSDNIRGLKVIG